MLYHFKLYINKGAQRRQLSLSYFVSEVAMAFIIYLPTLPYNILFTERRGLSSRLSRNLQLPILCRPTSSLKRCSTIHFLIWNMYLGVHSVILHYLFIIYVFQTVRIISGSFL